MSVKTFISATGAPVADNTNSLTAGPLGLIILQDIWLIEKLAHFDREVIPERRMHAKGWGAYGTFTITHDITRYTKAKIFSEVGKQTPMFARFSTVAGERGAADAERDIRGFALKFYTEEGNWDIVGNNTQSFSSAIRSASQTSIMQSSAIHALACAAPKTTGTSGPTCPKRCIRSRLSCRIAAFRRVCATCMALAATLFLLMPPTSAYG
jgi:hypothetical protein